TRERRTALPLLLIASLAASSRIFLRLMPVWYGFVYIVPVYLLVAYLLLEWLPAKGVYSRRVAPLWLVTMAAIGIVTLARQHEQHAMKRYPIATPRGVVLDEDPYRARILSAFLPMVRGRTLLVVPEGIALDYLAGARNPLSFHTLTPPEIAYPGVEETIVAELRKSPPERVAIVTRPVGEFGFRGFGVDYGVQIMNAFRSMYDVDGRWTSPTFTLTLLRRKDSVRAPTASSPSTPPEFLRRSEARSSAPAESR
ncbi:MAG TPA: hypothetical protein VNL91_03010, partial [Thermoanaerobaculia bacterium]|nr:hypothetical protein [Thermoanaerobaculia bacterium]